MVLLVVPGTSNSRAADTLNTCGHTQAMAAMEAPTLAHPQQARAVQVAAGGSPLVELVARQVAVVA